MTVIEVLSTPQNIFVNPTNIEIFHRTQQIVVNPTDNSVTIVNAGPIGPKGATGSSGTIIGNTPPANTDALWVDTSVAVAVLKWYNSATSIWEPITVGVVGGAYSHTQGTASTSWTITHNLGFKPSVTTFDGSNQEVEGDTVHTNNNQCVVTFSYPISGSAFLS